MELVYPDVMKQLLYLTLVVFWLVMMTSEVQAASGKPYAIAGKSWYVASADGRRVYFERNKNKVSSIASLSKMMAILVIVEEGLKLDAKTVLTDEDWALAAGGSRTRLKRNVAYTNRDLLHAALLGSDNRAVLGLGRAVGLNSQALTAKMNARARAMGLKSTSFADPTGIAHENVSTPYEVSRILKAASENALIAEVMQKVTYTVVEKPSNRRIVYNNTNILTRNGPHRKVLAGKTGFNTSAGYCVAVMLDLPGLGPTAFVVMGSSGMYQRFADVWKLIGNIENLQAREKREKTMREAVARRQEAAQPKNRVRPQPAQK